MRWFCNIVKKSFDLLLREEACKIFFFSFSSKKNCSKKKNQLIGMKKTFPSPSNLRCPLQILFSGMIPYLRKFAVGVAPQANISSKISNFDVFKVLKIRCSTGQEVCSYTGTRTIDLSYNSSLPSS